MKKLVLATLIGAGLAVSQVAAAAEGTVNFTGKLVETTCTVSTDSKTLNVTLPTLATSALKNAGDTGGATQFTIKLENCPTTGTNKAKVHFSPIPVANVNSTNGRLLNKATSGAATNVEIQLLDFDGQREIDVASLTANGQNTQFQEFTGTTGNLVYFAQYYATGQTTAGAVQGQVQYDIAYE